MTAAEMLRGDIAQGALNASIRLVAYRSQIENLSVRLLTHKEMYVRYEAQEEQLIINRANRLIELGIINNG